MGSHQRLNYIHVFRALAITMIVASHAIISPFPQFKPILNVLLQDGTVLFVFISGFLFQYLSDGFSYGNYLKKKFFNVVCPYLVTSVIGISWLFFHPSNNPFEGVSKLLQIPMFLTTGYHHNLPTWYIPMTCVFFLCSALLLKMERKKIFADKSLLFCGLAVLLCVSLFIPRYPLVYARGVSAWQAYVSSIKIIAFLTVLFFPIYILGMFMAAHREYIPLIYKHRKGWLLALLLTGAFGSIGIYLKLFAGRLLVPKLILTLIMLGYLEHYDQKIMNKEKINHVLDVIATCSFSIFFLHEYIVRVVRSILTLLGGKIDSTSQISVSLVTKWIIFSSVEFFIALLGSLFIAMLIKKLLTKIGIKHTRYFIGT